MAISDAVGKASFHVAPHSPVSSLFELPPSVRAELSVIKTTTLDDYLPRGGKVDLIKLDIEGAEPSAWRGMQRVVTENNGVELVMEWSASHFARTGEDPVRFVEQIRRAGFSLFLIEDIPPNGPLRALHDDAIPALEAVNVLLTRFSE
jgi:hypothetical protein